MLERCDCRAVLPGIAASAMLSAGSRTTWLGSLAAGLLAAAAPVTGVLERIHMDVGDGSAEQHGLHLAAACSAATLTTGESEHAPLLCHAVCELSSV